MVLKMVTRTAGRSIYSYNRSVVVPKAGPMLTLTGAQVATTSRNAAGFGAPGFD